MAYQVEDLAALEVVVLGVLSIGLPPARAAGDDRFRFDHVAAVVAGLDEGDGGAHLGRDGVAIAPAFRAALRGAIEGLGAKGLLGAQAPGMPVPPGGLEAGLELDLVNPDEHPVLLDRYLGQLCMERLFNVAAVYPYLMERYSRSGEVWRRLREAGYGS